jgi:putative membrane protein
MRWLLRHLIITGLSVYLISLILPGFSLSGGLTSLALTAVILTLVTKLVKPLINLVMLPINLLTLGLFRWVTQALTLYLADWLSPDLAISSFSWHEWHFSAWWTLIFASFLLSLSQSALRWLW